MEDATRIEIYAGNKIVAYRTRTQPAYLFAAPAVNRFKRTQIIITYSRVRWWEIKGNADLVTGSVFLRRNK